jgi:hypothetical protein
MSSRFAASQARSRGHSRSSASWATSTVGARVSGSWSKVRKRAAPKRSSTSRTSCELLSQSGSLLLSASSSARSTRRRVSSLPSPRVTRRRKSCRGHLLPGCAKLRVEPFGALPERTLHPAEPLVGARLMSRPSRRSNSSVSAYCSSGSAPGWSATRRQWSPPALLPGARPSSAPARVRPRSARRC